MHAWTLGGAFYPDGYSVVMFPDEASAVSVARKLSLQKPQVQIFHLPPASILSQITPTVADSDNPLPSAGSEGATVRAYTKLARAGHHGLLVETPDGESAEWLMSAVRKVPYSMAQRYRKLVIEDL
ncbi:hypothetical protein C7T35_32240 [Variovorax sp. WS11]|nr:hypothetical protein [Variovorax sp. WS11]PSL80418.1 hypothetical protein C7T35_32240 [Variovorax sp. WS11]